MRRAFDPADRKSFASLPSFKVDYRSWMTLSGKLYIVTIIIVVTATLIQTLVRATP